MTGCDCVCHGSPGAYPLPCSVPGGCGPHDDDANTCKRGPRCAGRRRDQAGDWQPAPATRDLCAACERAVEQALAAAPWLWRRLREAALDRQRGQGLGERVTTSPGRSFGLNSHPLWLADVLLWTVTAWADAVITTADRPRVDRARQDERGQVTDACLLLGRYLSVWLAHAEVTLTVTATDADPEDPKALPTDRPVTVVQSGWEACAWLLEWQWFAEHTLRLDLLTHWLPEPCPQCDVPGVCRRRDGSDTVECTRCGKTWTLDTWQTFVHAWFRDAEAPEKTEHHGPGAAVDGQDARRGTAAHMMEEGAA